MSICVILVGRQSDIDNGATPHKVMTNRDYLAHPALFNGQRPRIINLSRTYTYQSRGYYASLLAEARGHRIIPSVETMIDLSERRLYENAIPELEDALNKALGHHPEHAPTTIRIYFGYAPTHQLERFARLLFDWFRAPALEVTVKPGEWAKIQKIAFANLGKLDEEEKAHFNHALDRYTQREWRAAKQKTPARYSFATLCDPHEAMPPSTVSTLKHWARIAGRLGVDVAPIGKKDLSRLANYDALFIRETTSISNHTYRFARRAQQEGMPVIDDPVSMIRCTNKVYLNELMQANGVPVPPTVMIAGDEDLTRAADLLGFPMVIKIPDSSFSRGVKKVSSYDELKVLATAWLEDSDLLIAQKYMPTRYDWRVGVLDGKPLFACHYLMAKHHWQIVNHDTGGKPLEGGFRSFALADAPPPVIETGLRAARCIGKGLYGVDLKETEDGVVVIEVNDNPNLEHGVEDAAEKDEVWLNLTRWFIERLERTR
ncbi:RimK family alpha-L-glutamate ligase [Phyllobacterium salinisoli]|uniref:RimK family alpha-L-glutamate ligase n=1 Tax=Phyllobacterium salinisoli TaxID=1899321 RepID=A0A368K6S1_9HYPH|nr:RimK family protein [Phyllobacterium salinisoli]RCS25076.1 RimK family alpha-L-glutamate ligase [Phyllobacterium salinisoli]